MVDLTVQSKVDSTMHVWVDVLGIIRFVSVYEKYYSGVHLYLFTCWGWNWPGQVEPGLKF